MNEKLTAEQIAAIDCEGKVIVSASAGSGKTFVMIQKLVNAIENGVDLDSVLAVTFTKKAASQMKDKLRSALISRMDGASESKRAAIKFQLSKISTASISTIHALCAKLIRTYFYILGVDSSFDIISEDDAVAAALKDRAIEYVFDEYYETDNADFMLLQKFLRKKRSDKNLKYLVLEAHSKLRQTARYERLLNKCEKLYTEQGFNSVVKAYSAEICSELDKIYDSVADFRLNFKIGAKKEVYEKIFQEMFASISAAKSSIFGQKPSFTKTHKPTDGAEDKESGANFKAFKDGVQKRFNELFDGLESEESEKKYFLESGLLAVAFFKVILAFDAEYTALKRDENKLDYNDLEHFTLQLLNDEAVLKEICSKFTHVFVDEYQDVNPVQEEIISKMGANNVFLVGDIKQAIYGFRGSRSLYFAQKYNRFSDGAGSALKLSSNFRSSDGVINFVNGLFSQAMSLSSCEFDYASTSLMTSGGGYPEGAGSATIEIFGKEEESEKQLKVYSVIEASEGAPPVSREGLAVLKIVESELKNSYFDLKTKTYKPVQRGDICILTRKRNAENVRGIVRALTSAGYRVSGAEEQNICLCPEVKTMIDILSYLDNGEQDIPLASAMLSPIGGFTEDELAKIRIAVKGEKVATFRQCCKIYSEKFKIGDIAVKLERFEKAVLKLKEYAEILDCRRLIDKILETQNLEPSLAAGGGDRLKNVLRLAQEGENLTLSAFLEKLKESDYEISSPAAAPSDSIKIMTMHASKGLEFPVVIIADICKSFKGQSYSEIMFDDEFTFAPKYYDGDTMLYRTTLLRRFIAFKEKKENVKNELNLFYVACTRAMYSLHILATEKEEYNAFGLLKADCFAQLFDMSRFPLLNLQPADEKPANLPTRPLFGAADENMKAEIKKRFMQEYEYAESVNLPVKSSATAILRGFEEERFVPFKLFPEEGETGAERGTAYHRFLELCDFSIKDKNGITQEAARFLSDKLITEEQYALLDIENLVEILNMSAFSGLEKFTLHREREFLCRIPANEILDTRAKDYVLIQGAIDLLAVGGGRVEIIDYKYSKKSDNEILATYKRQLQLYKKAVALILKTDEEKVGTTIINIFSKRQITV